MSDVLTGDIVSVNLPTVGHREGRVIGQHIDYAGRLIVQVQFEPGNYYNAWWDAFTTASHLSSPDILTVRAPTVTRVRRTTYINGPRVTQQVIERTYY
ncbi:uncharacterized protein EI90DRAFT_3133577 [Cantharellus anzutake]|uniref:uncharacterized protein n=1 Tax=Cantharellus anzutake TaxID=1750568 RepID=UPI001907D6DD|nr:uncharacterized protein EI90DRAFT_3133577 [Cantharellus anzutake]KAF8317820.1 hypothetical protein EI90DRAFT_3133577 [Cantharellus anzutake]